MHEDEEDRLQQEDSFRMQDSLLVLTSTGAPGSTTNRVSSATAMSYFIDTEIRAGNWIFTPGARFEDISMQRLDYATGDPARAEGPTRIRTNSASVLIPGMGTLYVLNDHWRILGGVHKGISQAMSGHGGGGRRRGTDKFLPGSPTGDADHHNGRLRVHRILKLRIRPVKYQVG